MLAAPGRPPAAPARRGAPAVVARDPRRRRRPRRRRARDERDGPALRLRRVRLRRPLRTPVARPARAVADPRRDLARRCCCSRSTSCSRARPRTSATSTSATAARSWSCSSSPPRRSSSPAASRRRATGLSRHDALSVGVLLNTRGLVELVALGIGLSAGLLDSSLYAVLVIMAVVTTIATSPSLRLLGFRPRVAARAILGAHGDRDRRRPPAAPPVGDRARALDAAAVPDRALLDQGRHERRRRVEIIHSVFIEEMLHLTLAANILNAVGGSPNLDYPGIMPSYPTFLAHSNEAFQVGAREVLEGGARDVPADRAAGRARRAARGRQLRDDRPVLRGDRGGAHSGSPASSARRSSSAATPRGR